MNKIFERDLTCSKIRKPTSLNIITCPNIQFVHERHLPTCVETRVYCVNGSVTYKMLSVYVLKKKKGNIFNRETKTANQENMKRNIHQNAVQNIYLVSIAL